MIRLLAQVYQQRGIDEQSLGHNYALQGATGANKSTTLFYSVRQMASIGSITRSHTHGTQRFGPSSSQTVVQVQPALQATESVACMTHERFCELC